MITAPTSGLQFEDLHEVRDHVGSRTMSSVDEHDDVAGRFCSARVALRAAFRLLVERQISHACAISTVPSVELLSTTITSTSEWSDCGTTPGMRQACARSCPRPERSG